MRRRAILLLVTISLLLGIFAYMAWSRPYQEAYTPDNLIRFHVIAHSDLPEDQALKLAVRDAVLEELRPLLAKSREARAGEALIEQSRERLEQVVNSRLAAAGVPYRARVEIGAFDFPTRSYLGGVLPAGRYKALRVVLGEGGGQNWWCVLFPPLCFVDIASEKGSLPAKEAMSGLTHPQTSNSLPPRIVLRWRIVELWQRSHQRLAGL